MEVYSILDWAYVSWAFVLSQFRSLFLSSIGRGTRSHFKAAKISDVGMPFKRGKKFSQWPLCINKSPNEKPWAVTGAKLFLSQWQSVWSTFLYHNREKSLDRICVVLLLFLKMPPNLDHIPINVCHSVHIEKSSIAFYNTTRTQCVRSICNIIDQFCYTSIILQKL